MKKLKITAVGAHLDDIEIGCGGSLAYLINQGHSVNMLVLSQSGYEHYDKHSGRNSNVAIKEGKNAAQKLGVKDLKIFDFPTKDIPYHSSVVETLEKEFDRVRPDIIFTHWQYDTHKSHQNTGLSTFAAARYYDTILMYEPFVPAGRSYVGYRPQVYFDITSTINNKIEALKEHKSEFEKFGEAWIEAIKARSMFRGGELVSRRESQKRFSLKYSEAYEVLRMNLGSIMQMDVL